MENNVFYQAVLEERERLEKNLFPEHQYGLGMNYVIKCNHNADEVLDLSKKVLLKINYQYDFYSKELWDDIPRWKKYLPKEFISNFKEYQETNIDHKISFLSKLSKIITRKDRSDNEKWTFENWIFLMDPIDRMWFWWGATVLEDMDNCYFIFSTKVLDDPFLSGSLKWLFLGSGAIEVIETEDIL